MTREDKRLVKFSIGAMAFVFAAMWMVAELMLWAHPLNDVDKKCMRKSMIELDECFTETKKAANEK